MLLMNKKRLSDALDNHTGVEMRMLKIKIANKDIGSYIKKGYRYAVLETADDTIAYLPEDEYSRFHKHFKGNINKKNRTGFIVEKVEPNVYILSAAKYEAESQAPTIKEFQDLGSVIGTVIGFNSYSAILKYKNIEMQLSNADFSDRGDIKTDDVLKIGDEIPVVFDRLKKKGRVIKVKPKYSFPKPAYLQTHSRDDFEEGKSYLGKVIKTTPKNILVMLGKDADPKDRFNASIVLSSFHPDPIVDGLITNQLPVMVTLNHKTEPVMLGKITSVRPQGIAENRITYYKFLKEEEDKSHDSNN